MPKLFWKQRNEPEGEVLQISRPTTRGESPGHQIFHLQDNSTTLGGDGASKLRNRRDYPQQDTFRVEAHHNDSIPSLEDSIAALRAQVSNNTGREFREREKDLAQSEYGGFSFPDDLSTGRENLYLRNGLTNGRSVYLNEGSFVPNGGALIGSSNRELNEPGPYANGFEVDLEDDITKMAAQRDQQRGSTKYVGLRGMMAPIISKDDDTQRLNTSRRFSGLRNRSESMIDLSDDSSRGPSVMDTRNIFQDSFSPVPPRYVEPPSVQRLRTIGEGRGPIKRSPNEPPVFEEYNARDRDIMAQSIRRQTLRSSKHSILDSSIRNDEVYNRINLGTKSPHNFTVLRPETKGFRMQEEDINSRGTPYGEIPSSHDDVQILNLQGFMDSSMRGQTAGGRGEGKVKPRRSQFRRSDEVGTADGARRTSRARRKKKSRHLKGNFAGTEDDEVVLKDIDDMDEKMASLVIGPTQTFKESDGRPITFEEANNLRQILTGNSSLALPKEWLEQSFFQNKNSNLSYGIIQKKGGPCGVLASVQAHLLKSLIFGSRLYPSFSPASPLRPSVREWSWALSVALTEILWRISDKRKAILALPGSLSSHFDYGIGRYTPDGLTETLFLYEFAAEDSLLSAVESHLQVFTTTASSGCVLLLYSALLTRGLDQIAVDMDSGGGFLINSHGYASQEVVNLLLTGQATTNTFDGEKSFGDDDRSDSSAKSFSIDDAMENFEMRRRSSEWENRMILRGIRERSDIGLLSLFEHYGSCKVGTHLKSPEYPVWVICSESHYSVVFAREKFIAREENPQDPFDIYFYDGLALQEDEIRLTIDLHKDPENGALIPPLELCLRTRWPKAHISWNGTDPIL